jgi:transcriptional regulator with XRE-family HTH domain
LSALRVALAVPFRTGRIAVHEDLLNAVSNLVHRHVLVTLHAMTGAMLARLDGGGADLTTPNHSAPRPPANETDAKPTVITAAPAVKLSTRPETIARRARKQRAKLRQANGANGPGGAAKAPLSEPPTADAWPALRSEFHAAIKARGLSRDQAGAELGVSKSSIIGWLWPQGRPPSAANINAIRAWLDQPPPPGPQPPPDGAEWQVLREWLKVAIADTGLTHAQVAAAVQAEPRTVATWLAGDQRGPGAHMLIRLRGWVSAGAVVPVTAEGPAFMLLPEERDRLTGHLSLATNALELRERFGATKDLLEKASMGAHLDAEVIARLRGVLANGAAPE